ncbi:piezo-type mechanosensitive ion channel component 1 isoform X2 [Clarias magur]|uniref:Piezo-type mechanosensitive ion channel component 1 isoform X2 n=1 Tax=Clarias magur TaxID=1594786 RepID=A0A8J4TE63_CLAMG|nr:piezo-type mechanosensitive ion channel component 1 isoform X2 [Clarias magur]
MELQAICGLLYCFLLPTALLAAPLTSRSEPAAQLKTNSLDEQTFRFSMTTDARESRRHSCWSRTDESDGALSRCGMSLKHLHPVRILTVRLTLMKPVTHSAAPNTRHIPDSTQGASYRPEQRLTKPLSRVINPQRNSRAGLILRRSYQRVRSGTSQLEDENTG